MNHGLGRSRIAGNNLRKEGELTRNYDGGVSNVNTILANIANANDYINRQFPSSTEPPKESAHQKIHGFQAVNPHEMWNVNHISISSMNMGYNSYNPASMNMGYNSYNPQYFGGSSFSTTNIYDGINLMSGSDANKSEWGFGASPEQVSTITTGTYEDALSETEVFSTRAMPPGGVFHSMSRSPLENFYQPQPSHPGQNLISIGEKQCPKQNFYLDSRRVKQRFQYNPFQSACGTVFTSELDRLSHQHQFLLDGLLKNQSNESLFNKEANFGLKSKKRKHDVIDLTTDEPQTTTGILEDVMRPFYVKDRVSQELSVSLSQQDLPFQLPFLEEWPKSSEVVSEVNTKVVTVDSENLNLDCYEVTLKGCERNIDMDSDRKVGTIITEEAMGNYQKGDLNLEFHEQTSQGYERNINVVSDPKVGTIITQDAIGNHQKENLNLDSHEQTSKGYERNIDADSDPKVGATITEDAIGNHLKENLNLDCHEATSKGNERNINAVIDRKVGTIIMEDAMVNHEKENLNLDCHEQTPNGYERNIDTTNQEIKQPQKKIKIIKKPSASLTDSFTESQITEHLSSFVNQKEISENTTPQKNLCQLCSMSTMPLAPTPKYCASCDSRIKKNVGFYCDNTNYSFCTACFKGCRGANITLFHGGSFPKSNLEKAKNDAKDEDSWVQCNECQLWQHRVCGLYNNEKDKEGKADYVCPKCSLKEIKEGKWVPFPTTPVLEAKNLPRTNLSDHIEQRLFSRLKQEREETSKILGIEPCKVSGAEGLVVRVVSSVDKQLEVKQNFRDIFQGVDYPAQLQYRSKIILLFQRLEGVDVCLFGMCVQEFGSKCDGPNNRCVYISYLDSVKFFKPERNASSGESLRTFVYHQILIGYLEHCKKRGFATCYIWACPLIKGEDYIFYCHPETQRTPKQDKLRHWYKAMIKKGVEDKVIVDHTNLYNEYFTATKQGKTKITTARLPYFDGDYWSGGAESIIKNLEAEESSGGGVHSKLPNKRASLATGHDDPVPTSKDALVMKKLGEIIHPLKENFMVVRLQHVCTCCREVILSKTRWFCKQCNKFQLCSRCYNGGKLLSKSRMHTCQSGKSTRTQLSKDISSNVSLDTKDKDDVLVNSFFETRDEFLIKCQESKLQFNTLHHAKYSSIMMLYNFKHKLVAKPNEPSHKQQELLNAALGALDHASRCTHAQCSESKCQNIRNLLKHASKCTVKVHNGCKKCQKVWLILKEHAKICAYTHCNVPRCMDIRKHMADKSKRT